MLVNCVTVAFPLSELKALALSEGDLNVLGSVDSPEELKTLSSVRVPDLLLLFAPRIASPVEYKNIASSLSPSPALLLVTDKDPLPGFECFPLKEGYAKLKRKAKELVSSSKASLVIRIRDKALDERIANIFLSAGIPPHIKGYRFLREAIKQIVLNPDLLNSITKELYPAVALRFGTTSSKVERAIRHAIEVAWSRGKIDNINNIYGVKVLTHGEKPTNGELIALIADKLLIEYS